MHELQGCYLEKKTHSLYRTNCRLQHAWYEQSSPLIMPHKKIFTAGHQQCSDGTISWWRQAKKISKKHTLPYFAISFKVKTSSEPVVTERIYCGVDWVENTEASLLVLTSTAISCADSHPPDICMLPYQPCFVAVSNRGGGKKERPRAHDNVQRSFDRNSWYLHQRPIIHSQLNQHTAVGSLPSRQWLRG